ncbi:MAG: hypothetical protein HY878_00900 [Deltaproteobacteria bacterium]|nr:hypothetical protein [Deltaproteobacteria bacterium]
MHPSPHIGPLTAFLGGFFSFFSIWQLCIMQTSPFFIAFLVGVYFIGGCEDYKKAIFTLLIPGLGYIAGFSIIFALLGSAGLPASGLLLYHIKGLRVASGIFIILVGITMTTLGKLRNIIPLSPTRLFTIAGLLLGMAFAFAYSPCIPPILSQLMNYASMPENKASGTILLTIYGSGLSAAFVITGIVIAISTGWVMRGRGERGIIIGCSFLLILLGIMVTTGFMTNYKAFLLGFWVK